MNFSPLFPPFVFKFDFVVGVRSCYLPLFGRNITKNAGSDGSDRYHRGIALLDSHGRDSNSEHHNLLRLLSCLDA